MSESTPKVVTIKSEPIELCQLMKFAGMAGSGGEAKQVISDGLVKVNGELESRKRRKMVGGDTVEFGGEAIRAELAND